MTIVERRNISNGIWLCGNCADMIDRDAIRFPTLLLHHWKRGAERAAESELGKQLPSTQELSVFKTKVLGQNVAGTAIVDLVSSTHSVAERELERLDPRFSAKISHDQEGTRILLSALEPVECRLCIPSEVAIEFREKLASLQMHGHPLEMEAAGIHIEGSPLFEEALDPPSRIAVESLTRFKGIQRIAWTDWRTGRRMAGEIVGSILGGSESFTFRGDLFDGLYGTSYQIPFHRSGLMTVHTKATIAFAPWEGRKVRQLPHLDKFRSLCEAIAHEQPIESGLEVDGRELSSIRNLVLMAPAEARDLLGVLTYITKVRDILEVLEADVPFQTMNISADDARLVDEAWLWICGLRDRRGRELGTVKCTLVPSQEEDARTIKERIRSGEPSAVAIRQNLAERLNLLGQTMPVKTVQLCFSNAVLTCKRRTSAVKVGKPLHVEFIPSDDCTVSVSVRSRLPPSDGEG